MTLDVSQDNRIGKLHTPLGDDELVLLRFSGSDGVNELFNYRVEALGARPDLDFDKLVGHLIRVELTALDSTPIHFSGIVTEARFMGVGETGDLYRFDLHPWFWLAGRRRQQRIFHEKTVPDILNAVLGSYGEACPRHLTDRLTVPYPTQEYTVQYGESDLDFCRRLMERYGINFHFEHGRAGHSLVLTDSNDNFDKIPGRQREHIMIGDRHVDENEHFWSWSPRRLLTTGAVRLMDYNYDTPVADLETDQSGTAGHPFNDLEAYEYPGLYKKPRDGEWLAGVRLEQERAADFRQSAEGDVMTLKSGMIVRIYSHADATINGRDFICLKAEHEYTSESYGTGDHTDEAAYRGRYEFTPEETPFRAARRTPLARVSGPQTAFVVGKRGEEIDVDAEGRILVRFHWDLDAAHSMRCRVAQLWASKNWGAQFIPRVGMEVVVEFLEGDPDKPLVTGCVYHAQHPPPFSPEQQKNRSGIKSNSTKNATGYNELMFDDTAGEELFRQHAQFDMETKVLHDERREIDNDRNTTIGGDEIHDTEGNRDTTISQNDTLAVGQVLSIDAKTKIELTCGTSKITMTPTGITIEALKVDVKATTALTTSGLTAEHSASAIQTIKGALVKIN